ILRLRGPGAAALRYRGSLHDGRVPRESPRHHRARARADRALRTSDVRQRRGAMSLAWISVGALVVAVILSCTTTINVGVLSLAFALIVGVFLGGMSPDAVLAGFPVSLFITLVGVTLLFSIAECNGTLARLTARAVRLCRGHAGVLPIMFFALGLILSTIGAGATPASALLAPPAMAIAGQAGVPPLLMAIMAGHGV